MELIINELQSTEFKNVLKEIIYNKKNIKELNEEQALKIISLFYLGDYVYEDGDDDYLWLYLYYYERFKVGYSEYDLEDLYDKRYFYTNINRGLTRLLNSISSL